MSNKYSVCFNSRISRKNGEAHEKCQGLGKRRDSLGKAVTRENAGQQPPPGMPDPAETLARMRKKWYIWRKKF